MKKITLYLWPILILAVSCQQNETRESLLARKKSLLNELSEINQKLEKISLNDSSTPNTLRLSLSSFKKEIFRTWIYLQGKVEAEENVSVSSEIPGMITNIHVVPGQSVNKGQVLAETDNRALLQQLEDLKTNAELVRQLYEKQKALWEDKIGTEVQYLQVKTQKESIEKKIAALEEQIRMTKIISPITGVVDAVDIKIGQMVSPGMPAIRVVNLSKIKVRAELAESYAGKVRENSEVIIRSPDLPDSIQARIGYVQKTIHPVSRSFQVEIPIEKDNNFYPNQTVLLRIREYESSGPVAIVPAELILKDEKSGFYLWIVRGGVAHRLPVKAGKSFAGSTEILSEIPEDALLIDELSDKLEENVRVQKR